MNFPAYPINVFWSYEDSAWVADVPDSGRTVHA